MTHPTASRVVTLMAVIWAALAVGGCQSAQPTTQPSGLANAPTRGTGSAEFLINPVDANALGFNTTWTCDLVTPSNYDIKHIVLSDNLIVAIEVSRKSDNTAIASATSLRDGVVLWQKASGNPLDVFFAPLRYKDRIIFCTEHEAWGLDAETGELRSLQKLDYAINNTPTVQDKYMYAGGVSSRAYCYNLVKGYREWVYRMPAGVIASPVLTGNTVFVTDAAGQLRMLDANDGKVIWKGRTFAKISATPVVSPQGVFVPSEDQTLYCLIRGTGQDRWKIRANGPFTQSPILMGNSLYVPMPSKELWAVDPLNGKKLWDLPGTPQVVNLREQKLLISTGEMLQVVDNQSGKIVQQAPTKKLRTVLVTPDGKTIILIAPNGKMQRLDRQG